MGSVSLFQVIFPTQGSSPSLPHCRWILYQLSHKRSPFSCWVMSSSMGCMNWLKLMSKESYYPTISSFVAPFSSYPQSFPASGSSQMSQLFASDGQSIGVSASTSVLPMNTQDWSALGWTDWLDLLAIQGTLKCLLWHHSSKASILQLSAFFIVQLSHPYMTTGKTIALTLYS